MFDPWEVGERLEYFYNYLAILGILAPTAPTDIPVILYLKDYDFVHTCFSLSYKHSLMNHDQKED